MKEFIEYNYDVKCENLSFFGETLYFKYLDKYYLLSKLKRDVAEYKELLNFLINNNVYFFKTLINKFSEIYSEYNQNKYVLMECESENEIIELPVKGNALVDVENNWGSIWESRIAQLIKQKVEYKLNKDVYYILDYYIGITEICINNYNFIRSKYSEKLMSTIQHNRIKYPLYSFDYYNSTNYLFDYFFRDLAEYLKAMFFYADLTDEELINKINLNEFDDFSANMLIIRVLYPTYFYEVYDSFDKSNINTSSIFDFIKKSSQFENFILKLIYYLSQRFNIVVRVPFKYQH
ncbi:MAG: hypothetical protein Q4C33_03580 [bacterium]|nr:hypothetical protein [bacterium]